MTVQPLFNPFHEGERYAQSRAGVGDVAKWAGGFIRDYLPEQHRDFHTNLPFLIAAGADADGQVWASLIDGEDGFISSPDARHLTLATDVSSDDPLSETFEAGADIGVVGIELATRRRNRFSGHIHRSGQGYSIEMRQTFGNCPQYIHERSVTRVAGSIPGHARRSTALSDAQIAQIRGADTLFIGSGHVGADGAASNGFDASHRGGAPGFVHVVDGRHLKIPDYAGNNFFNTIGNLVHDPRIGLLFIDFETGSLLQISGRAQIDWDPKDAHDPDALRVIDIEVDAVIDRPAATSLRWTKQADLTRALQVTERVEEADGIVSFRLLPADGKPLAPFLAGQHLPIDLNIPSQRAKTTRTYSLSGDPADGEGYRITVKREDKGLASRYLHAHVHAGSVIMARDPAGDFTLPTGNMPVVLVSAGVGLTPMVSMLHALHGLGREVYFVHGTRDGHIHAMKDEVAKLSAHRRVFYSQPSEDDRLGVDFDQVGRITAKDLLSLGAGADAHYLFCGPVRFMADLQNDLMASGVPSAQLHSETFGPAG